MLQAKLHESQMASTSWSIGTCDVSIDQLWTVAKQALDPQATFNLQITEDASYRIQIAADFVSTLIKQRKLVYGVNTGFGHFAHTAIPEAEQSKLQRNIILSHAAGVGQDLPRDIVMAMWLIRLHTLSKGHSGIRLTTLNDIISSLNHGVLACVPSRGSVGASGDLAPAAHCCLPLLGQGMCTMPDGKDFIRIAAPVALDLIGQEPLQLGPKEGLSLVNGTHLSLALAIKAVHEATRLLKWANLAVAMGFEATAASRQGLSEHVARAHVHSGTQACASDIREWLQGDSRIANENTSGQWAQDPYCLRCAPQVHGVFHDELVQARASLTDELDAITDNPLLFPDDNLVLSGGNFHAIYPARISDSLSSVFTTLGSISERRTNLLMNKVRTGLPDLLVNNGGVNSGFMMAHVTTAALVAECRTLCMPASVHSISTNCDQEDHVSMAPIAGFHALEILEKVRYIIAIEILCHCQALDLRSPLTPGPHIQDAKDFIRSYVPMLHEDRPLANDIETIYGIINQEEPPSS